MNNENKPSVIAELTAALASMAERAAAAEAEAEQYKKRLEIVGGQIVDKTTGELVEGVQIIEKPDTFTVDV